MNTTDEKGLRPFEYLEKIGFLGPDVVAAHCVWLSDEEIEIIKKHGVKVSHNPCSNMKLASGVSPVSKLIENDICVSIGTDGASSNNNLDLIEELKTASLLQKVSTLDPKVLSSDEAIEMATIKGAETLGLSDEIGSIEVGKKADIILIDTNAANMTPDSSSLSSNVIYSANGSNVDTTICDGKILMENKKLTELDENEIYAKARQAIKELKEAIFHSSLLSGKSDLKCAPRLSLRNIADFTVRIQISIIFITSRAVTKSLLYWDVSLTSILSRSFCIC